MRIKFESLKELSKKRSYIICAVLIVLVLALTPYISRIAGQETPQADIISLEFAYGNSAFDPENDGIETINNAIDFSASANFPFELNESNLAMKYEIYSIDEQSSTIICNGAEIACNFIGLAPSSSQWDEMLYIYYDRNGAAYKNIIGAQAIYVDYNVSAQNPFTEVFSSEVKQLFANFTDLPPASVESVYLKMSCQGCRNNTITKNTEASLSITAYGNTSSSILSFVLPSSWHSIYIDDAIEEFSNETHTTIQWSLSGNNTKKSFTMKSPAQAQESLLEWDIEGQRGSSKVLVVEALNASINSLPVCYFPLFEMYINTNLSVGLPGYCSDEDGDAIVYAAESPVSGNALEISAGNETGIKKIKLNASDFAGTSEYDIEILVKKRNDPYCSDIPNISIEVNKTASLNLSMFCIDPNERDLMYSLFEMTNIMASVDNDTVTFAPYEGYSGVEFSFVTADNLVSKYFSNTFKVNVSQNTAARETLQEMAEINKPVTWKKTVVMDFQREDIEIDIPKEAFNISVMDENELLIDDSKVEVKVDGNIKSISEFESKTQSNVQEPLLALSSLAAEETVQEENATLLIAQAAKEIRVEYQTEAPLKEESILDDKTKIVKITSQMHYTNVRAYSDIPESKESAIKLYWIKNGTKEPFRNFEYFDTNNDTMIDRIEWIVPHLSNQSFEIDLKILDIQSYPVVGEKWLVRFNTSGYANLTISAINQTSYSEMENDNPLTEDDLKILELKCDEDVLFDYANGIIGDNIYLVDDGGQMLKIDDTLSNEIKIKSIFAENYSCENKTGSFVVKVLTPGVHNQMLEFGSLIGFANNFAINGLNFTDTTDADFGQGALHMTNVSGSGNDANVTLNFSTVHTFTEYNRSGNFTSRIFDSGQNHTVWDRIAWEQFLPNSTDVVGYAGDDSVSDFGVFYRNGSIGTNLALGGFDADYAYTTSLRRYTLPAGISGDDIMGIGWDSDATADIFAFLRNGSTVADASQADLTTDIAFTVYNTWSLPADFNRSDVIGITIDSTANQAAAFMKNGSILRYGNEVAPFAFTAAVLAYTLPAGFSTEDVIGSDVQTTADDMALYFRNGSSVVDASQTNFNTNVAFANVRRITYHSDANITTKTNISLHTRVSNNTVTWTPWSASYIDNTGGQQVESRGGRYMQYKAVLTSPKKTRTPYLENVSINYTIDEYPPLVNASLNNTVPVFGEVVNFTANASDAAGLQHCQFIVNKSGNVNEFYNFSLFGQNSRCSQNFTIPIRKGGVINFTVLINDSYNNINRTQIIATVGNSKPETPMIVYPAPDAKTNRQPLPINVTAVDLDGDAVTILYYVNGKPNGTSTNTTLNATDGVYILNASTFDGAETSISNATINFTLDTARPIINGTLNKSTDSIRFSDTINATFNATDFVGLFAGQVILNDTSSLRYFNFSLTDLNTGHFSQNFTVSCVRGCVINVTGAANDSAGNLMQNSTVFTVANTAPTPPSIVYPSANFYTNMQPLDLNVTFARDIDNDPLTIRYYINAMPNGTSLSNTTLNATDGYYILNVSLFDGIESTSNATVNFTLDTKNPSVSLIYPGNASYNASGFLQMLYIPNDINLGKCSLFSNFSGVWKQNQTTELLSPGAINSFNMTENLEGLYVWNVLCNDTAGNFAFNATNYSVIVDLINPKIEFAFPTLSNGTNTSALTLMFNATHSDNNPGYLKFSLNGSIANDTMQWAPIPNYTNLTRNSLHGIYSFYFWVNDSAGRYNQTETRTINADTKLPRILLGSPSNNTWNSTINMSFFYNTSDDFLGTKNCTLQIETQKGAPYINITKGEASGVFNDASGNYSNLSKADNSSFFYIGSETIEPVFETSAFFNLTFNLSNLNPSMITSLELDIQYCHSGNPLGGIRCNGTAPTGAVEIDQDVSIYNYSARKWTRIGRLENDADGTGGNLARSIFAANGTLSDYINSSQSQAMVGIRAHFTNVLGENTFLVIDFAGIKAGTNTTMNAIDNTLLNFTKYLDSELYNWNIACVDYVNNINFSENRLVKVDHTFPYIYNETINDTSIAVNEVICLNVTVNDTFSSIRSVFAELDRPESDNTNVTLTNDTSNPSSCSGSALGNVWSYAFTGTEEGNANWSATYAEDYAGNINFSKKFGLNWSQSASVFLNSTKLSPLVNFEINESSVDINRTFIISCNATCRADSQFGCNDVTIFPQYDNGTWNDINNFSSQIVGFRMNKSCGNVAIGGYCNETFTARTSANSGNNNFSLRCRAKGANTPNDYSNETNITINDHPSAAFSYPNTQHIRGVININSSSSSDDRNISRYILELDDNNIFSSSSILCDTNESNCTFNTFAQAQCTEDTLNCFIRLNVSDSGYLKNSTFIQVQIDNTRPSVSLNGPSNNSYTTESTVNFLYTAFDTNLSACTLYHNASGVFGAIETNETARNATQDAFSLAMSDNYIVWNVLCNDTAGNFAFNSTNFTLTIDTQNPGILFVSPTKDNDTYVSANYITVNVSINDTNFANISFYLYNSQLQLVNETNFTTAVTLVNFTNLADANEAYYYNVTARDRSGRENSTPTRKITLDNTYPRINFTGPTPPNNTYINSKNIVVNATLNDTNFANASFYLYDASFSLVNQTNRTMSFEIDNVSVNFTPLNLNLRYYYNVTVTDKTGLVNYTESRQVILDNTTPSIRLNSPGNNTLTLNTSIPFNFSAAEANPKNCTLYANFSSLGFRGNVSNSSLEIGAHTILMPEPIADGFYFWNIRCHDLAENSDFNSTNYTIEIDSTPPSAFSLDWQPNQTESQNRSPYLNWSETVDGHFKNYTVLVDDAVDFSSVNFVYKLSGNASNNSLFVNDNWAGNTAWFWKVIANDLVNQSTNSTGYYQYIIDNISPQISLILPFNHSVENDSIVNFRFNVTDVNTIANCSLAIDGVSRAVSPDITKNTTNTISFSAANGNHNWSINCTDRAGNTNSSSFRNVTVDAPPLLPTKFIDTTEDDFGQGIVYYTNVTGSGDDANVTMNYTVIDTFKVYNNTGNFTSRIFDTGAANTNLSMIKWYSSLRNSSDAVGFAGDDSVSDFGVFYRNGSIGTNLALGGFDADYAYTTSLRRYTLPAGISGDDIMGIGWDSDGTADIFAFLRNGSTVADASQADLTTDIAFTAFGAWSLPADHNRSDVIGITIDSTANQAAAFMKNGSILRYGNEISPFTFTAAVLAYSLPSGFSTDEVIGVDVQTTADDMAIFFRNGSSVVDASQTNFNTNVDFTNARRITYHSDANITESTNITLQSRASNDTITWTPWSSSHLAADGEQLEATLGRYVQYKAVFGTFSKYKTPDLENVTINYTETNKPRINLTIPTPANNSYLRNDWVFVNSSIYDEHSIERCRLEFDSSNESMLIRRDLRNATCFFNKTSLSEGRHGFRVYANDSFGNMNISETRNITIDLTAPSVALTYIQPDEIYNINNVTIVIDSSDNFQLNTTFIEGNWSSAFTNNTMTRGSGGIGDSYNFTILSGNLSGRKVVYYRLNANDTAGNLKLGEWLNFSVIASVANVSVSNPLAFASRYENETLSVNATVLAVNGTIKNCIVNISNQSGLVVLGQHSNRTIGNLSNGTLSNMAGWILNGTIPRTYIVNVSSNCSDGDRTIYSIVVEVTTSLSNLSESSYAERVQINGVNYFHVRSETGVNWWLNGSEEVISLNNSNISSPWFRNKWLIIINDTLEYELTNVTWDSQRTGADFEKNYTFVQFTGRLPSGIEVNFTKMVFPNSQNDNVTISLRNTGSKTISNAKIKMILKNFNISNNEIIDTLTLTNSSGDQENYTMANSQLFFNQSSFGSAALYFSDAQSPVKGSIYFEYNMSDNGIKAPLNNFTVHASGVQASGADFAVNVTFDLGSIAPGSFKALDPGAGLATPGNIRRTSNIANLEASEAGVTYTDVTAVLTDNNFATQDLITTRSGGNVRVLNIVNNTDPAAFDSIFLRVRVDSMDGAAYHAFVYSYNPDNITVNLAAKNNRTFLSTEVGEWVNMNITEASHLQDGFEYLRVRLTPNGTNGTNRRLFLDEVMFNFTDQTPPKINLTSPVDDLNTTSDTIMFNFTVSDRVDTNMTCNISLDGIKIFGNLNITNGSSFNFTNTSLPEGVHKWNVTCYDDSNNLNWSARNFTIIRGPSLVNATLMPDNESINITWVPASYAQSYNIYIKDSFMDDFGPVPNASSTHANFTDYEALNKTTRFYKVAAVKGSVNATSARTVGKYEFELLNNTNETSDFVLISLPFNITRFVLNNGSNNGSNLITKPLYCIQSLWSYNATISQFRRTDFNGTAWIPAAGSENFTSLSQGRGYWAQINKTCNLTIVGEVPIGNITVVLEQGWNIVGFYSANSSRLPQFFQNPYPVVVNPANSVKAIDRYNATSDKFEVTIHHTVSGADFGWIPSSANRNFNTLDPTRGYYYDVLNTATWTHKPVS